MYNTISNERWLLKNFKLLFSKYNEIFSYVLLELYNLDFLTILIFCYKK